MRRVIYLALVSVLATMMVLPSFAGAQEEEEDPFQLGEDGVFEQDESGGAGGAAPGGPALPLPGDQGGGDQGGGGQGSGGQGGAQGGAQGSGGTTAPLPGSGGLVVPSSVLLPAAAALLLGSGVVAYTLVRRRSLS